MTASRRPLGVSGLVLCAILASGCEGDSAEPGSVPDEPARAPLTGRVVEDDGVLERPVVAVKVDNAPGARPQVGLDDADMVLTELVEGGITRFIALYHAVWPDAVGPVRSGREVDAELLPPFEPVLAVSGSAPPVRSLFRDAGLVVRREGQPADAWTRRPDRPAPHNLVVQPAELGAQDDGGAAQRPWPIDESDEPEREGPSAGDVRLDYSPSVRVEWHWDEEGQVWLRSQDGAAHLTGDEARLSAANVIVARVEVSAGERTDAAGNPVMDMDIEGEGEAVVLVEGQALEGRWRREAGGHFRWVDGSDEVIELAPGRTWVELVPTSGTAEVGGGTVP